MTLGCSPNHCARFARFRNGRCLRISATYALLLAKDLGMTGIEGIGRENRPDASPAEVRCGDLPDR
jgi:hypothetical protein